MENQNFDEFDIMEAREWAVAVVNNHNDRKALELYNSQIRLAKDDAGVRLMEGIGMLADLLGVTLRNRKVGKAYSYPYFYYLGKMFYMDNDPDPWRFKL